MKMILRCVPDTLLHDLPAEDQAAIRAAVGSKVTVVPVEQRVYPECNEIEVEWRATGGVIHTILVPPDCLDTPHL